MLGFLFAVIIWYLISKFVEVRHYNDIKKREKLFSSIPVFTGYKMFPISQYKDATLVYSECALATDVFKRWILPFLSFFGLNIVVYEKLLDRARREAILRLKEQCQTFSAIVNLRVETVEICSTYGVKNKSIKGLQILVSGTAVNFNS